MNFKTGQYLSVGLTHQREQREYSIFSGEDEDYLEILVKEVSDGKVSRELRKVRSGDELVVDGPFGYFTIDTDHLSKKKFLLIATGTGISPFHSFVKTHPHFDYTLLHGVSFASEQYSYQDFERKKILSCISREPGGDFSGRVTTRLKDLSVSTDTLCYLCGNCDMIYDAFDILKNFGIPTSQIHTEVYF